MVFILNPKSSSSIFSAKEMKNRIAKPAAVMAWLTKRLWNNSSLTEKTRLRVYHAGLCAQHSSLWQWHMNYLREAGEETKQLPHEVLAVHSPHPLGRESAMQARKCAKEPTWTVCLPCLVRDAWRALAWPCKARGTWPHSQRYLVRWTDRGQKKSWPPSPPIQRYLQKRPQTVWHRHWHLGKAGK